MLSIRNLIYIISNICQCSLFCTSLFSLHYHYYWYCYFVFNIPDWVPYYVCLNRYPALHTLLHTHSLTLTHSHTHSHTLTHTHSLTHSLPPTLTHSHTYTPSLPPADQIYIYSCAYNYRNDHCISGPLCSRVDHEGISVLHGSRRIFQADTKWPTPAFRSMYVEIEKVSALCDIIYIFYSGV